MGCADCSYSANSVDEELARVRVAAKQFANEQQQPAAIYRTPDGWAYTTAANALATGTPVREFVSQH